MAIEAGGTPGFTPDDPQYVRSTIRKRIKRDEEEVVLLQALELCVAAKVTSNGVAFQGPHDIVGHHWTGSDHMGIVAFTARARRAGIPIPHKPKRGKSSGKVKDAKPVRLLPTQRDTVRPETVTLTVPVEEVVIDETGVPAQARLMRAKARDTTTRTIPPWYAATYARLPERLREVDPLVMKHALEAAGDDPRRITVGDDGSLTIWNQPR